MMVPLLLALSHLHSQVRPQLHTLCYVFGGMIICA